MKAETLSELKKISHIEIELNKDLSKFSTMKLKAVGDLILIKNLDGLKSVVSIFYKNNEPYRILGWGANILLPKSSPIPYLQLEFEYDKSVFDSIQNEYYLPASVSLATLTSHANKFGIKGWEVFTGIPATLGGAIFMNAGTNLGEIGSLATEVLLITKNGEEKLIKIDGHSFSYRKNNFVNSGDVIAYVRLKHFGQDSEISKKIKDYLEMRNRTQPLKEATCGCVFKNHLDNVSGVTCRAGHFIDIMGLKGLEYKNLQISPKHANFMENKGESQYEDVLRFIEIIKSEMELQYGFSFETEVEF